MKLLSQSSSRRYFWSAWILLAVLSACSQRRVVLNSGADPDQNVTSGFECFATANLTTVSATADTSGTILNSPPAFIFSVYGMDAGFIVPTQLIAASSSSDGGVLDTLPSSSGSLQTLNYIARRLGEHTLEFYVLKDGSSVNTTCSATVNVLENNISLSTIALNPQTASVPLGTTRSLVATGTYSNTSTANITSMAAWSSSNPAIATVSDTPGTKGLVTPIAVGTAVITATLEGISQTASITVSPANLVSLSITPGNGSLAKGLSRLHVAIGLYSDGTSVPVTELVNWSSSAPAIASISNTAGSKGRLNALVVGSSSISASLSGITAPAITVTVTAATVQAIAISPTSVNVTAGQSTNLVATATFTDLTTSNYTESVNWASGNTAVATVSSTASTKGRVTAVAAGSATITASLNGLSATASVSVVPAVTLSSLTLSSLNSTISPAQTVSYVLTARYSDSSNVNVTANATWSSSVVSVATVGNAGTAKGVAAGVAKGSTQISAAFGGMSATTTLTVNVKELYFYYTGTGTFDLTLDQILGTSHDFSTFNFKTTPFKLYVSERLLSHINYAGKAGYLASDISKTETANSSAKILSINRNVADRTAADAAANSRCTAVPDNVFSADEVNYSSLQSGGDFLNLSSYTGSVYIFRDETRDRFAIAGSNCYPTIHSSRGSRSTAVVTSPTFVGYPWDADGYVNTYGNGAYIYVDTAGKLHLRYRTQSVASRVVFLIGITAN